MTPAYANALYWRLLQQHPPAPIPAWRWRRIEKRAGIGTRRRFACRAWDNRRQPLQARVSA